MKKSLLFAAFIVAASSLAMAAGGTTPHPVEMGGNDCVYCHAPGSTAENKSESLAYSQWEQSRHAANNVKCVTCHGDETDFKAQSSIDICLSCHPQEVTVIKRKTKGGSIVCVNCHTAHDFPVKPEEKTVHK